MKDAQRSDLGFALMTAVIIIAAHAIAYLSHEFSHSFTAWALGYMSHPLALDYGELTPANAVLLLNVGDNVQYDRISSGGSGLAVATIALAGAFVGNGVLYFCVNMAAKRLRPDAVITGSMAYWLMMMCAGNIWSYIPIRAITTHADIAIAAGGLGVSVWTLFPILLVPSLLFVGHFFVRTCPWLILLIAQEKPGRIVTIVALTVTWFFMFFGSAGLFGSYGDVSQAFSVASAAILMPLAVAWLWKRCSGTI